MIRNRIIHQNEAVYVGPAFVSGQSYSTKISTHLDKVQSISYNFPRSRTDGSVLGKGSSIHRPTNSSPSVEVEVNYILSSFHNENALGFNIAPNGMMSQFPLISGICDETDRTKDKKNLYLAVSKDGTDMLNNSNFNTGDIENVLIFHDCQVQSYSANFVVNQLPEASVSLKGIDSNYFTSGGNLTVPILNKKNLAQASGVEAVSIPSGSSLASEILIPGNINATIYDAQGSSITTTGFAPVTNNKIQDINFNFDLNRRGIDLADHEVTFDNLVTYPVVGSASMSFIEHGKQTGSFSSFLNTDSAYSMKVEIKNKAAQAVMTLDFKDLKIGNINYSNSIGDNKQVDMDFSFEIDPDSTNKGLLLKGTYY